MNTDGLIPTETQVAHLFNESGEIIYIGIGFRNGREKPPTIAGVAFNADKLAELKDVVPVNSLADFGNFLKARPRIPQEAVPSIMDYFGKYF